MLLLITYNNKKIEDLCTNAELATKKLGKAQAKKLKLRLVQIQATDCIEDLIMYNIGGCHKLVGDRSGQYAMHLLEPYRLIFNVAGEEVEIANIIEIVDYH